MINIVVDKYNIPIKEIPIIKGLKELSLYKEIPESFLELYTELSYEEIDEIISNSSICNTVIESVYSQLDITNKNKFVKSVSNSLNTLNSITGVLFVILSRNYGYSIKDLINLTIDELIFLFVFELKLGDPKYEIDVEKLKNVIEETYDKNIADDFVDKCCDRLQKLVQDNFEKEMEQLNNL